MSAITTSDPGLCLVTGSAGYTGSHLVKAVLAKGYSDAAKSDFGYQPIKSVAQGMVGSVTYYLTKEQA